MTSRFSLLPPASITLLGGFAIIVCATLALGAMTQNQTGSSIALAATAFRAEMRRSNGASVVIPISTGQDQPLVQFPEPTNRFQIPARSNAEDQGRTNEFATLLSELQRVAGGALQSQPFVELSVDIVGADINTHADILQQACEVINAVVANSNSTTFELRHWAASPTTIAWIDSVRAADRLRNELQNYRSELNERPAVILSSSAIWPHADRIRPKMTIIVRQPVADQSDANFPRR